MIVCAAAAAAAQFAGRASKAAVDEAVPLVLYFDSQRVTQPQLTNWSQLCVAAPSWFLSRPVAVLSVVSVQFYHYM